MFLCKHAMYLFWTIALFLGLSCTDPAPQVSGASRSKIAVDSLPLPPFKPVAQDYAGSRKRVENQRKDLKTAFDQGEISLDSVGKVFTQELLNEIIPHWFGTPWAFSGHTETPRKGEIACGYFVSTTLLHAGLPLNRFRLAQQSPEDEALMLSLGDTVWVTQRDHARQALDAWRTTLRDGLYFIGLGQSHVGFLFKSGNGVYLIHSNYNFPQQVMVQRAEESVLMGFQQFHLTDLTFNHKLLQYWLTQSPMPLQNKGIKVLR